jgi:hypothetical protein
LVVDSRSLNAIVAELALQEKAALKTYMQVELNDYLQEQMESELFEGVDELEKSQFLGNFFHWMRNVFMQVKREDVTPLLEKEQRPVELEPIVASDVQLGDGAPTKQDKSHAASKSLIKKTNSLVQGKMKTKGKGPLADYNDAEKMKRRR